MKASFEYLQHAGVQCSGTVEVPAEIIAQGTNAVRRYVEDNEDVCDTEIVDWNDRLDHTFEMDYEAD